MRSIAILIAIVASTTADQEVVKPPQEIIDKIYKFATPCAKENNVDVSMTLRLPDGTLPRDEAHNKFLFCFAKNSGYITDDGHMVAEKLGLLLKDHPLQDKFKEAINKCNEVTKETPIATAVEMNKCFAVGPPIRVQL